MGLDNYIMLKKHKSKVVNKLLSYIFTYDKYFDEFEICYYRKCWNLRYLIMDATTECFNEHYELPIKHKEIKEIIKSFKSLNEHNWEDEGSSIWAFEEMEEAIKRDIKILKRLYFLMFFLDLQPYFIDSY